MTAKYQKYYEGTPMGKYVRQRANAQAREIPWEFTFETWWQVWEESGKWDKRGKGKNAYVMSRIDDEGHYCPENVKIQTLRENTLEHLDARWAPKQDPWSPYERTTAWEYTWNGVPVNRNEGQ